MFLPNLILNITRKKGFTEDGEETFYDPIQVKGSIINLRNRLDRSSVRADSSASRGRAEQYEADVRLLIVAGADVERDDLVTVDAWPGKKYQVSEVFPRFNLQGKIDHLQVDCVIWQ